MCQNVKCHLCVVCLCCFSLSASLGLYLFVSVSSSSLLSSSARASNLRMSVKKVRCKALARMLLCISLYDYPRLLKSESLEVIIQGSPGKSQKEGHENQGEIKELGGTSTRLFQSPLVLLHCFLATLHMFPRLFDPES